MARTVISGEFLGSNDQERLAKCRELAEQAESLAADAANPETRRSYLELKEHWDKVAAEFETDRGAGKELGGRSEKAVHCRACRKSHREVKAMVEMGGFIFCDECINTAATIITLRKAHWVGDLGKPAVGCPVPE